jgi:hypothetical protein
VEIIPTIENGELVITGVCQPDERRVHFGADPDLYIRGGNPVSGSAEVVFSNVVETRTTLELYNYLGNRSAVLADGNLSPGEHVVSLPSAELASGAYILVLRTGNTLKTLKVILSK